MLWSKSIKQQQEEARQAKIDAEFRKDAVFSHFDRIVPGALLNGQTWETFVKKNPWAEEYPELWHRFALAEDRYNRRARALARESMQDDKTGNDGVQGASDGLFDTDDGEDNNNMSGRYGTSYMERKQLENEHKFIGIATDAINKGKSFQKILDENKEYSLLPGRWQNIYSRVLGMKVPKKNLNVYDVLAVFSKERAAVAVEKWEDREYEKNRGDLLKAAADHKALSQVKREMDLPPECAETLYRRAQAELGVKQSDEREDPDAGAFMTGFYNDVY